MRSSLAWRTWVGPPLHRSKDRGARDLPSVAPSRRRVGGGVAAAIFLGGGLVGPVGVASAASLPVARAAVGLRGTARPPADTVTTITNLTGTGVALTFNTATIAALKAVGVTVAGVGGAIVAAGGASMTLPITSGYAEVHS